VERIVPAEGPTTGHTRVRVLGKDLAPASACQVLVHLLPQTCQVLVHFGEAQAVIVLDTGTEIVVFSPQHPAGKVPVTVTVGELVSAPSGLDFAYKALRHHHHHHHHHREHRRRVRSRYRRPRPAAVGPESWLSMPEPGILL